MLRASLTAAVLAMSLPVAGMAATTTTTTIDFSGVYPVEFGDDATGNGAQVSSINGFNFSTDDVAVTQGAYDGALGENGAGAVRNEIIENPDGTTTARLLRFWNDWGGALSQVTYVDPGASVGEFVFTPGAGITLTLNSFQMAGFDSTESVTMSVFGVSGSTWSPLWTATANIGTTQTFSPNITSTGQLRLQWTLADDGDIDYVAIDNISFTSRNGDASVIPLPASLPLLLGGLGLFGLLARRRAGA